MADWEVIQKIDTDHKDLIHDLAYDFYGKRLATCSSDRYIRVWDKNAEWTQTCSWEAHSGSIWKVCWAHPEFGQVIASCGFDGQVFIWEENERGEPFRRVCNVCKFDKPVVDVKFSPRNLGLKLATGWQDGVVRIYEAMDVMNLSQWSLMGEFDVANKATKEESGCHISWNPSSFDPPSMVVGCSDGALKIFQYAENLRKWQPIDLCSNNERHTDAIHDVCWAPNLGRSYHLIASASKDKSVRIWRVKMENGKWQGSLVANFADHDSEVWRVQWNVTGTILASSGDDGSVRLFQTEQGQSWSCIRTISADKH